MDDHIHRLVDNAIISQLLHVIVKFAYEQSITEGELN